MYLNATFANGEAPKTTVIDQQLNEVSVQVSEVEGLIASLSGALSQVLTPDGHIAKLAAACEAKAPLQSVLANELGEVAGRLRSQADMLRDLIARLEV